MKSIHLLLITIVIIIGAFLILNSVETPQHISDSSATEEISDVLRLEFTNYAEETIKLENLIGTPLVLNTWASWCPFCVAELPDFATVQAELGDQVIFVAINRAESLRTAEKFTDDLGVSDDLLFLLDKEEAFYKAIGGFTMPETLFIDRDGHIINHKRGFMNLEEIREQTNLLIQ